MNNLSWFLYAVDVTDKIGTLIGITLLVVGLLFFAINIAVPVSEGEILEWKDFKKWWARGAAALFFGGLLFTLIPSKSTMYAMAASEVGERVVKTEAVQGIASDATKALQVWIKKQIEPKDQK